MSLILGHTGRVSVSPSDAAAPRPRRVPISAVVGAMAVLLVAAGSVYLVVKAVRLLFFLLFFGG